MIIMNLTFSNLHNIWSCRKVELYQSCFFVVSLLLKLTLNSDKVVGLISGSGGGSCLVADDDGRDLGRVLCRTPAKDPVRSMSLGGSSSRRPSIFCFCIAALALLPPSLFSLRLYRNFIISASSNRSDHFISIQSPYKTIAARWIIHVTSTQLYKAISKRNTQTTLFVRILFVKRWDMPIRAIFICCSNLITILRTFGIRRENTLRSRWATQNLWDVTCCEASIH